MKKIFLTIIGFILFFTYSNTFCQFDSNTYDFLEYKYSGIKYKINIPENITYLEYCYYSGKCVVSKKNKRIIKINELLIKKSLKPLY